MNREDDKLIKDMLKKSMREITNPEFDHIIMNRIMIEDRRRFIVKRISLCFLIFLIVALPMVLVLPSALLDLNTAGLKAISGNVVQSIIAISENSHFIIPFIILLVFKMLIASKLRHA
jgi:hypothetical protein